MCCAVDIFSLIGSGSVMFLTTVLFGEVQGAMKVSLLMIGQQAIMDAYLCLLHLTAGILVGTVSKNLPTHRELYPCVGIYVL
jgi:hypothetical protein